MRRVVLAMAVFMVAAASAQAADGVIGLGVQGRPHAGNAAVRALYHRHGLAVPHRYRHHHSTVAY